MSSLGILAEGLSKRYRIGTKRRGLPRRRSELIGDLLALPLRNFRRLKGLSSFNETDSEAEDVIWALRNVSFEIQKGEVVGIVGRNGAGKSTLLKLLSRITEPTEGHIAIGGRVGSLLEVGTGFHPELTGRENVFLNGTLLGMTAREVKRKFDEIVDFADVEAFIDTPVKRYSSGMRVRLAFAVAAQLDPEIMLVDEVLAVGDAAFQRKCLARMSQVAEEGRTVVFVSHNMGSITRLCQRAIWLEKGQAREDGPASDVVAAYLAADGQSGPEWTHPPGHCFFPQAQLVSARLLNSDRQPSGVVQFDERTSLEIAYDVLEPDPNTTIVVRLTDAAGNIVWSSMDTDGLGWNGHRQEQGSYLSICNIQEGIIKPGRYYLSIGSNTWSFNTRESSVELSRRRIHENVLAFDVSEVGYDFKGQRPGVIAPPVRWEIQRLEQAESSRFHAIRNR